MGRNKNPNCGACARRRGGMALLIAGVLFWDPACQIQDTHEGAGTALDFSLDMVNGESMDAAEFFGSVVLINFWDTWCGSCIEEQDDLNRLYTDFREQGLEIIGVSLARYGLPKVSAYLEEHSVEYTSGIIGPGITAVHGTPSAIPLSIIIDRDGAVVHRISGGCEYAEFVTLITPLLNE